MSTKSRRGLGVRRDTSEDWKRTKSEPSEGSSILEGLVSGIKNLFSGLFGESSKPSKDQPSPIAPLSTGKSDSIRPSAEERDRSVAQALLQDLEASREDIQAVAEDQIKVRFRITHPTHDADLWYLYSRHSESFKKTITENIERYFDGNVTVLSVAVTPGSLIIEVILLIVTAGKLGMTVSGIHGAIAGAVVGAVVAGAVIAQGPSSPDALSNLIQKMRENIWYIDSVLNWLKKLAFGS